MAKVLIVDDEDNNRYLLTTLLHHAGHSTVEAATGAAGAQAAEMELPDLIVVDLSLPDIPGTELIRRIRQGERTSTLPIAIYTATQLTPAIEEIVEIYGIRGIIPKPADAQTVLKSFEKLLSR